MGREINRLIAKKVVPENECCASIRNRHWAGTVIRQYADIGGETHIRVWRNLRFDHRWKEDEGSAFPVRWTSAQA